MNRTLSHDELVQIAKSVWSMILDLKLNPLPGPLPVRADERTLVASVQIDGAWEGVVSLRCSGNLARRATAAMFGMPPAEARPEQIQDALGELANMIGGNVEALLPEPCALSIPTVVDGVGYSVRVPGRTRVHMQVALESGGDLLVITVFRKDAAA